MSKTTPISAGKILDFLHECRSNPIVPIKPSPVDRVAAGKLIAMPQRSGTSSVASRSSASNSQVVAMVTQYVDKLFPTLKGAMRQEMVAQISQKVSEDPHVSRLLNKVS